MNKTPGCDPTLGFADPSVLKSKTYFEKNIFEYEWAITFDEDTNDISIWFKKKKENLFFRMNNSKRNEKQISNFSDFENVKAGTWPIRKVIQRSSKPELIDQNDEMKFFSAKLDLVSSQKVSFLQMLRFEQRLEKLENRQCDYGGER